MSVLTDLIAGLAEGRVAVVDLTAPLSDRTPILQLPPPVNGSKESRIEAKVKTAKPAL